MCLECEQAGEEEKMMFCDSCDRVRSALMINVYVCVQGFHTYCLDPPLENIPDGKYQVFAYALVVEYIYRQLDVLSVFAMYILRPKLCKVVSGHV